MMKSRLQSALLIGLMGSLPFAASAQTLQDRVERLERMAANPVLMQHSQRMNEQQREIQSLYDEVDRLKRQIQNLEDRLARQYRDVDTRIEELSRQPVPMAEVSVPLHSDAQTVPDAPDEVSQVTLPVDNERARYDEAFALMRDAQYSESIAAFEKFAQDFPTGRLASNAYYWMGEAYLIQQDFEQAFASFNKVLTDYASSDKVPDSLLRGADSLVGLNRLDEAKAMYQDLKQRFGDSRAAQSADRRLQRIQSAQ